MAAQTRQVMTNLATALAAAGVGVEHLVQVFVLLVDGVDVAAGYRAAAEGLATVTPPLVTAVMVSGLGVPGALVEVSAIAVVVR
ncbi:RidA family protein [Nocardia sp. NPDC049707]|uniref:RidA family protein n=1 Tax=Nocardia sp. NPDC049707 TaxID=3154735 RepID=UPI003436482D